MKQFDILIVVDAQNDFMHKDGVLYNPNASDIIPNIVNLCVENAFRHRGRVIFTKDTHELQHYNQTVEGNNIPFHTNKGSWGWDIVDELKDYACNIFEKRNFCDDSIEEVVRYYAGGTPDTIRICGVCTDICVISTALYLRSKFPDTDIVVYENCCSGTTPEAHEAALMVMKSCLIGVEKIKEDE